MPQDPAGCGDRPVRPVRCRGWTRCPGTGPAWWRSWATDDLEYGAAQRFTVG